MASLSALFRGKKSKTAAKVYPEPYMVQNQPTVNPAPIPLEMGYVSSQSRSAWSANPNKKVYKSGLVVITPTPKASGGKSRAKKPVKKATQKPTGKPTQKPAKKSLPKKVR
jgi:hypothetical protein